MYRFISWSLSLFFGCVVLGIISGIGIFYYFGAGLPDYKTLANYEPPVVSRLYSGDGRLFAEYAHEKRIYVPHQAIPSHVKYAFLSAEDKNFYTHFGLDIPSIISAALKNLSRIGTSKRPVGASTITQQVAKNFLLSDISSKVSYQRKIKEAILSFRIERAYSKNYIFELYLNEVYLGNRSYGVAAAALNYFNKSLEELSISEAAYLAALPKAPSRYNPKRYPNLTYARRNWVIDQMLENEFITPEQAAAAKAEKIEFQKRDIIHAVEGSYFAEEVRRELIKSFGDKAVYENGYVVRTTLDPDLQKLAEETLQAGLEDYDRDHGWRGPLQHLSLLELKAAQENGEQGAGRAYWVKGLNDIQSPAGAGERPIAVVLSLERDHAVVGFKDGTQGAITLRELKWARKFVSDRAKGPIVTKPSDVLALGDVVLVDFVKETKGAATKKVKGQNDQVSPQDESAPQETQPEPYETFHGLRSLKLCQIPTVSGALVAMEPHTGRVLAMQGGYSFKISQFNRATQALRQTGSAFKPFVYLAALEAGLTPSTVLEDVPFAIDIGYGQGIWKPNNWDMGFKGAISLRRSFELSRNVAAIRMIHEMVGMKHVVDVAKRLNIDRNMPVQLSGVLGASETTVLRLCAAYAMIANGGRFVVPSFFDHVQDRRGKTILVNNYNLCQGCDNENPAKLPQLVDLRPWVTDPIAAYQLTSLLRGVVERGTGRLIADLPHEIAAKSGTTNDYYDAWMVGYSPTLVVAVFVGFDNPRSLGYKHYGAKVAGPIFKSFMSKALASKAPVPFKVPEGASLVRVNPLTGARALPQDEKAIYEAFRPGTEVRAYDQEDREEAEAYPYDYPESDAEEYPFDRIQSPLGSGSIQNYPGQQRERTGVQGSSTQSPLVREVTGTGGIY